MDIGNVNGSWYASIVLMVWPQSAGNQICHVNEVPAWVFRVAAACVLLGTFSRQGQREGVSHGSEMNGLFPFLCSGVIGGNSTTLAKHL